MDDRPAATQSDVNPYATSPVRDRCDVAWTDGDVEFTDTEISVRGDFELPPICIHTGATTDLIQRERKLTALSPIAVRVQWVTSTTIIVICLVHFFESLLTDLIPGLNQRVLRDSGILPTVLFANAGLSMVLHRWSHNVAVRWYLSQSYAMPREKWRRIFGVSIVLVATLALVMIYETANLWWLALVGTTAVAGVTLGRERSIGTSSFRDGRFILKGHSAEFAHAWAAKTAAPHNEYSG